MAFPYGFVGAIIGDGAAQDKGGQPVVVIASAAD
jgi:hypothetical protein